MRPTEATGATSELQSVGALENLTLWERVHAHLRRRILSNELPPGTVLGEVALARSLGVSRGPIREAIGRLATEGLVTVRPRRGAVVSSLSREEFLEAYQVREALETLAVRLAVSRISEAELDQLQSLIEEMVELADAADVDGFFRANSQFHGTIVAASRNGRLRETYGQLADQMARFRTRSLELRGTLRRSITEHRAILRAIKAGDEERAARILRDHIRVPQARLEAGSDQELVPAPALAAAEVAPDVSTDEATEART